MKKSIRKIVLAILASMSASSFCYADNETMAEMPKLLSDYTMKDWKEVTMICITNSKQPSSDTVDICVCRTSIFMSLYTLKDSEVFIKSGTFPAVISRIDGICSAFQAQKNRELLNSRPMGM